MLTGEARRFEVLIQLKVDYPVSLAFELRNAIPDAHLWILPNAGHDPVVGEHTPGLAKTALPFLRQWGENPHESASRAVERSA